MLEGKKSFIVAAAMIFYAVVVLGFQGGDWNEATKLILEGLALFGLRLGISNG